MSQLLEYQAAMTAYLTVPPEPNVPKFLLSMQVDKSDAPEKRISIYKNNVYSRFIDALIETFPATVRLVGEEFFRYAAADYIAKTPPMVATLLAYGQGFPQFLEDFPAALTVPYLADVARLEFLYLETYHAADAVPEYDDRWLSTADRGPPALHPSARLMMSLHQASRIWEINRADADFENVLVPQRREYLLVIRPEREVEVRRIRAGDYAALLSLYMGAPLAVAQREAGFAEPDFDFVTRIRALIAAGVFVGTQNKDN